MNADGFEDLLFNQYSGDCMYLSLNDGTGKFETPTCIHETSVFAVTDMEGDGLSEILIPQGTHTDVLEFNADGVLSGQRTLEMEASYIQLFDVDADGLDDFIVSALEVTSVFLNEGGTIRTCPESSKKLEDFGNTGDINGDGLFDMVRVETCAYCDSTVHYYTQTFTPADD